MTTLTQRSGATDKPGRTVDRKTARHLVEGAIAMSTLGASTAVSAHLTAYPVLGGQALRYLLATAVLFAIIRRKDRKPATAQPADGHDRPPEPRAARRRTPRATPREWALITALSLTGLVLFNVFVLAALRHTDPATLGSVVSCTPLLLSVLGPIVASTGRRMRLRTTLLASGLVAAGSALVQGFGHGTPSGLLLAVAVLVCEVLFSLLAVPLLPRFGELRVSAYVTAMAVPVLLVAGLAAEGTAMLRVPTAAEAAALLYLALPLTVGAFLLWYRTLTGLGPQRAGLLIGCVPISACAASAALGVGTPGLPQLAGVLVVVAGIIAGLTGPARPAPDRPARLG